MKKLILLFIFIILVGLIKAQEKCCTGGIKADEKCQEISFTKIGNKVICPVTGSKFNITKDSVYVEYKGKIYFFCCPGCKPKFESSPEKYIKEEGRPRH